jgi:two-component system chemotaxis sensor kinase CheA
MVEASTRGAAVLTPAQRRTLEGLYHARRASPGDHPSVSPAAMEAEVAGGDAAPRPEAARAPTIRIDAARLDRILSLFSEVTAARERLRARMTALAADDAMAELFRADDRPYEELRDELLRMRLVPLRPVFRRYQRSVRELASAHGKQARLEVAGAELEVDLSIVENLSEPLAHLIRNAIDHGIETPAVRRARGKDPCGVIQIAAHQGSGAIVVEITDDGAGVDRAGILASARARGLVPEQDLTDEEVLAMLFEEGVSTAIAVTELSGRGIGMDVVRRKVAALRGTVSVRSDEGAGTTVTLRVPMTVAIVRGLVVGVDDESYVIPLEDVVECTALPATNAGLDEDATRARSLAGVLDLRGRPLPYVHLREVWGLGGAPSPRPNVIVVEHDGRQVGLAVDKLLGESQAVAKPLGALLQGKPGVAGSSILGTGQVALIVDVPDLVRTALAQAAGTVLA